MGRIYEYDWIERNTLGLYTDQDIKYLDSNDEKKEEDPDENQDQ